jgi:hypothetical protein
MLHPGLTTGGVENTLEDLLGIQQNNLSIQKQMNGNSSANVLVDFDARTGHNHGTKFRLRQNARPNLYSLIQEVT